jgi:hypothetical protein
MRNTRSQDVDTLQNSAQNEPQSPLNNDEFEDAAERTIIDQIQERLETIERENQNARQEQQQAQDLQNQTMQRILEFMQANPAILPSRENSDPRGSPTLERRTPDTTISQQLVGKHYSKKQPDPDPLTDGKDPTFLSWKIGIQGKFRVNADHFENEDAKILYLFNRTQGDARKHLEPRVDPDHLYSFTSANEMIQYLASIPTYVDPFKARNARSEYNKLKMKHGQLFSDFQTDFIHLANEGNIPKGEWKEGLYERLTSVLKKAMISQLEAQSTYEAFSASCLFMDNEYRKIQGEIQEERRIRVNSPTYMLPMSMANHKTLRASNTSSATSELNTKSHKRLEPPSYPREQRQSTPEVRTTPPIIARNVTCYSCGKPGHVAPDCLEKKKEADLKEIEEEEQLPDEDSQESGKEDA